MLDSFTIFAGATDVRIRQAKKQNSKTKKKGKNQQRKKNARKANRKKRKMKKKSNKRLTTETKGFEENDEDTYTVTKNFEGAFDLANYFG